ncbi:MAG: mechanosensitive ion channel [Desulfobacterales bacterium]|nr:MAG: mechanosensitive ion channel [Desulfobacterales bacterium]
MKPIRIILILLIAVFLTAVPCSNAEDKTDKAETKNKHSITISEEMDDVIIQEATKVKEEFQQKVRSLFDRLPLGWNFNTVIYLYQLALSLPKKIPLFTSFVIEQSRVLGVIGSILVLVFIAAVLYSLIGQRRVMGWVEDRVKPLSAFIPEATYPFFMSGIRVVVSALIPLLLLGAFALINAMIDYSEVWFQLIGRLLIFWAVGSLLLRLLKESLTRDLFKVTAQYGRTIYRWARLALLYAIFGMAAYWTAEVFEIREDVLALLRFAIMVSVIVVLLILHLNKKAFISFLPELPIRSYIKFRKFLEGYYFPLLFVSFLAALLWCFGYRALGQLVLIKIWFTAAAFVFIMLLYHTLQRFLNTWFQRLDQTDENARMFVSTLRSILKYATVVATLIIVLNMLGLLNPLQRIMSFPIFQLGDTTVTFWLIVMAILILLATVYASRLAQSYFDYKLYPSFGIDPGLGYALNTVVKFIALGIGFLIALNILGINLRFFLVFAGAIGIGVGLGLQNMAANVISGFTIIFGGKIRKGDWIEVGSMLGEVTDIYLRATKVRTRDNIEYLVPNSNIISNTMVNYSLSSPLIRIELPVGVSYKADPRQVEKILLAAAENEPLVDKTHMPAVRFVEYADNSINFELLVWINVRKTPRRKVRSNLYFVIFEELAKAGIEIPFPQRDLHIRSQVDSA